MCFYEMRDINSPTPPSDHIHDKVRHEGILLKKVCTQGEGYNFTWRGNDSIFVRVKLPVYGYQPRQSSSPAAANRHFQNAKFSSVQIVRIALSHVTWWDG